MFSDRSFGLAKTYPGLLTVQLNGCKLFTRLFGKHLHFVRERCRQVGVLQAKVFDEWLDARDEALSAVIVAGPGSNESVVQYYRTLGLLIEAGEPSSAGPLGRTERRP